jgi:hypothetical protein
MVVYINDLELDVLNGSVPRRASAGNSRSTTSDSASTDPSTTLKNTPSGSSPKKPANVPAADCQPDETPVEQAQKLVNSMAENLVAALETAACKVMRLRTGPALPAEGLRIRGVFAETDERNRVRRLLVGSHPTAPKMLLFVGVNNLASSQQPLYGLGNPAGINVSRHSPIITVTSYSPATGFKMNRNAADDEFKNIGSQVVGDLNALLLAN